MLTPEYFAAKFNNRQYRAELTDTEEKDLKSNQMVCCFGASDDLTEFRGAVHDEVSEQYIPVNRNGPISNSCEDERCPYYLASIQQVDYIKATYGNDGVWRFSTHIPHATFNIFERDKLYCIGIVFLLSSLKI
jgi:hypothetical protein